MIYRSSFDVWDRISNLVMAAIGRWHKAGTIDRAVTFMICSGRPEFADQIWPLISHEDSQVHLRALRAGRRFRISALGTDAEARLASLPDNVRKHVLSEIVVFGGIDGIELATRLAIADNNPEVQASVISSLAFRRAHRFAAHILERAPDAVWREIARKGIVSEIEDPSIGTRARIEEARFLESEATGADKLHVLIYSRPVDPARGAEVEAIVRELELSRKNDHATGMIYEAHKIYPTQVSRALLYRLENDKEIPFRAEELIQGAGVVESGALAERIVVGAERDNLAQAGASVAGPFLVGRLVDLLLVAFKGLRDENGRPDQVIGDEYGRLKRRIAATPIKSLVDAILSRGETTNPESIAALADLLARQNYDSDVPSLPAAGPRHDKLVALTGKWASVLLKAADSTRAQMAELAQVIERLCSPALIPVLKELLDEDLERWREARGRAQPAGAPGRDLDDARISWTLQYQRAFAAIGGDKVAHLMATYLSHPLFGHAAASVIRSIWIRENEPPKDKRYRPSPDFSIVSTKRAQRQRSGGPPSSIAFVDAILDMLFAPTPTRLFLVIITH